MTLLEARRDPALFGSFFGDRTTWQAWEAFLATLFGLPLTPEQCVVTGSPVRTSGCAPFRLAAPSSRFEEPPNRPPLLTEMDTPLHNGCTTQLPPVHSPNVSCQKDSGRTWTRTRDLLHVRQAL